MNKSKLSLATASRVLLNVFLVIAMVVLASLIGVGGAALWIYGRPETAQAATKHSASRLKADVAANEARNFPALSPLQFDGDGPAQLTPARYVPTDSEIATVSDTPRYTYISYNGGRQQAHLRVNTVLSASVPAPLAAPTTTDALTAQETDRTPLTDSASRYITDARGRVIGIDGSASAAAEEAALAQQMPVARALPVQTATNGVPLEVRVASPVVTRKATSVESDMTTAPATFDVQAELSREDDRPVLRAQPVIHASRSSRPSMFGASDDLNSLGRN